MEPTRKQRRLRGLQAAQETLSEVTTHVDQETLSQPNRSRVPDSNLAQWKQERLAHHHAYYALLDKAFVRWKQVTELRKKRRQRVIAACQVGAKFFQRLYWNQWKETIKCRHEARANAAARLERVLKQVLLKHCFSQWRRSVVERQRAQALTHEHPKIVSAERLAAEQRLEVRGTGIQRDVSTTPTPPPAEAPTPLRVAVVRELQSQREKKFRQIIVFHSRRHYFQLWKQATHALQKLITKKLIIEKADRFRVRSAWRRWQRGFLARSEYESASRRAAFFLYYQLTRSSLYRLRAHATRQLKERGVSVVIEARVRRRTLGAVMKMWRQRLNAKLVFTRWREAVIEDRHDRTHTQHLQVIRDALSRSSNRRVLRQFFSLWQDTYTRKHKSRALVKILEGRVHRSLIREGFKTWRQQTTKQRRIQELLNQRSRSQVASVWRAWSLLAAEKQTREQQRRMAARFWYYRTLRKAFSVLQGLRGRRAAVELAAERAAELRRRAQLGVIVQNWREWSRARGQRRQQYTHAVEHHATTTVRHVFHALRENVRQLKVREGIAAQHVAKVTRRRLGLVFKAWKAIYVHERARNQELSVRLASYRDARALRMKRDCFQALDEHAWSRGTRRVVNAHARGHFQAKLLHRAFTMWNVSVAQLKWEHIFDRRAQHFRDQRRKRKCFQLWKANAQALHQEREQTKLALHHWKRVREKKAFDAWKLYIEGKRRQRERMHAALEFRHRSHIRDGLGQWIAGAAYLADQRSKRTVEKQATHTARVWSKVRGIALHWRWLAQQKKLLAVESGEVIYCGRVSRQNPEDHDSRAHEVRQRRATAVQIRHQVVRSTTRKPSEHHNDYQPAISEFVMLPRNRPRPRKSIELILESGESGADNGAETANLTETLHDLNHRYGFQFPTQATIVTRTTVSQQPYEPSAVMSSILVEEGKDDARFYEGWTIDELEKRLLHWHDRRQRLKTLQQSLEDFRLLLHQAADQRNLPQHDLEHMKSRLHAMEQQEASSRRQWNESRPEIQTLAERIKILRATTTAQPA